MVTLGPELRLFDGLELLWSQVFRSQDGGGAALGERAEQERLAYLAQGTKPCGSVSPGVCSGRDEALPNDGPRPFGAAWGRHKGCNASIAEQLREPCAPFKPIAAVLRREFQRPRHNTCLNGSRASWTFLVNSARQSSSLS
jgi:hypothetical protein